MNSPKKILVFSVAYYPNLVGGAEVAVKEITDRISDSEYEFHLITLRFDRSLPKEERIGRVWIHRLGWVDEVHEAADTWKFPLHYNKYFFPFLGAYKAWQLSRKEHFVLNWSIMANYAGFAALFFKMLRPQTPFLLTLQEGDPIDYIKKRVGILSFLFRKIFQKADAVQAISNYLADFGREMGFRGEVQIVPNGADVQKFSQVLDPVKRVALRKSWEIGDTDTVLVTASRLVVKNGISDVIKALPLLPPQVKFVVLGEGLLQVELKTLASKLKVAERVKFLGRVSADHLPEYLKACDIFIRPSLSEGFGNAFIEAMAAGIPVIATPVGGIIDFLKDHKTGLFCEPQNPQSIADRVTEYINNSNLTESVVKDARKMVEEKYDWSVVVQQMCIIFDKLTN